MIDYMELKEFVHRNKKEWLIVGKGPSFDRIDEFKDKYNIFGLNHVAEHIKVDMTNIIDLDVLSLPIILNSKKVLLPWHPHVNSKVSNHNLEDRLYHTRVPFGSLGLLKEALLDKKLHWYNLTTWKGIHKRTFSYDIVAKFFSIEAAISILANLGIRKINLLGIDGGTKYAAKFSHLQPLTNRRPDFNKQFEEIDKKIQKYTLTINNLGLKGK